MLHYKKPRAYYKRRLFDCFSVRSVIRRFFFSSFVAARLFVARNIRTIYAVFIRKSRGARLSYTRRIPRARARIQVSNGLTGETSTEWEERKKEKKKGPSYIPRRSLTIYIYIYTQHAHYKYIIQSELKSRAATTARSPLSLSLSPYNTRRVPYSLLYIYILTAIYFDSGYSKTGRGLSVKAHAFHRRRQQ